MLRLLAGLLLALALPCSAQTYPAKPILLVMPLQAGSAVDAMIRIVAQKMGDNMGRTIVVENQPGAAGVIGAERVKKAAPDGYTPGGLDYSSGGIGSPQHVAMEAFKVSTGTFIVHIPYRGATQAALDIISNQVQVHFSAVSIVLPHISAGRMRALGVPSAQRSPLLPEVPTMAEAGVPGFDWRTWASIVAPVGTPKPILDRLNAEVVKAVNAPDVREKLVAQGLEPVGSPPDMVTQWTQDGLKRMSAIVKRADIRAE